MPVIEKRDVCAVIVTYHPDQNFPEAVRIVARQVGAIIIVDNNSGAATREMFSEIKADENIHVVRNSANLGIAAALNEGVALAKRLAYRWILTLDQDTIPESNLVEELISAYSRLPKRGGIVGPDSFDGALSNYRPNERLALVQQHALITSGSFFPVAIYDDVGPFREDFFIDSVDQEFCLRLRSKGYGVFMWTKPLMQHRLGNASHVRFCGLALRFTNHAPIRRYYSTRNRLHVVLNYAASEPLWALDQLRRIVQEFLFIILFEDSKAKKLYGMLCGCFDFMRGRLGRWQHHPAD